MEKNRKDCRGSMTIEAALLLPLYLFFFLNLMSSVEMLRLHGNIETALWNTGRQIALGSYIPYRLSDGEESIGIVEKTGALLLSEAAIKRGILTYNGKEYLEGSPLTKGASSLQLLESSFDEKTQCLDIRVTYQVSGWFQTAGFSGFRIANRYYARAWTGYEIPQEEETGRDRVYVTETGKVYHETLECGYLKRVIDTVSLEEAAKRTNRQGEAYTLCWVCRDSPKTQTVYITPTGNRYHYTLECQSLKRTIRVMERKEAQNRYRPCSRCGG